MQSSMALNLSKAEREWFEAGLKEAEPYAPDDPIFNTLDADIDIDRYRATVARRLLARDDEEKAELAQKQLEVSEE